MLGAKIDVHAHFVPPCWREALLANGLDQPDGMPEIPVRTRLCASYITRLLTNKGLGSEHPRPVNGLYGHPEIVSKHNITWRPSRGR
jgi:hypothetical protein